jgi:hypothetical protein
VGLGPDSSPTPARVVLDDIFVQGALAARSFEVGQGRFLVWQPAVETSERPTRVVVIPNWFDEVRATVAKAR